MSTNTYDPFGDLIFANASTLLGVMKAGASAAPLLACLAENMDPAARSAVLDLAGELVVGAVSLFGELVDADEAAAVRALDVLDVESPGSGRMLAGNYLASSSAMFIDQATRDALVAIRDRRPAEEAQ